MLNTFGDSLRDLQKTSETAAGSAARTVGNFAGHIEDWAEEGIDCTRQAMRATPLWGAAFSLGIGALVGLFAYKRVGLTMSAKTEARTRRTVKRRRK